MTWQCQTCGEVHTSPDLLALYRPTPHLMRMSDPLTRLNAALEGRYRILLPDPSSLSRQSRSPPYRQAM